MTTFKETKVKPALHQKLSVLEVDDNFSLAPLPEIDVSFLDIATLHAGKSLLNPNTKPFSGSCKI